MQINVAVVAAQLDAEGPPVGRHNEALLLQGADRELRCFGADRKVDVPVVPRLRSDEGVDAPPARQSRIGADRPECFQDFVNVGHGCRDNSVLAVPSTAC
jgi:hypothetical protein